MTIDNMLDAQRIYFVGTGGNKSFGSVLAHVDKYDNILLRVIKQFSDKPSNSKHIVLCKSAKDHKEIIEHLKNNLLLLDVDFNESRSTFTFKEHSVVVFKVSDYKSVEHLKSLCGQRFTKITMHDFDEFSSIEYDIIRTLTGCFEI